MKNITSKKKVFIIAAVSAMAVSFYGCGSDVQNNSAGSETNTSQTVTITEATEAETMTTTTAVSVSDRISDTEKTDSAVSETEKKSVESEAVSSVTAADTCNQYGYYPMETPIYTSISVASLSGEWYLADDLAKNVLEIYSSEDDIYNGTWEYVYEGGGKRKGTIKLEYSLNQDGSRNSWYNFYEEDGEFWEGFAVRGDFPINDIYAGQSGSPHFVRAESITAGMSGVDAYLGTWGNYRTTMTIEEDPDTAGRYIVSVKGPSSAAEYYNYKYFCTFDEGKSTFVSEFGTLTTEIYADVDSEPEVNTTDGERAEFYADDSGITWNNLTDNSGSVTFTR